MKLQVVPGDARRIEREPGNRATQEAYKEEIGTANKLPSYDDDGIQTDESWILLIFPLDSAEEDLFPLSSFLLPFLVLPAPSHFNDILYLYL